jgi:Zn-dependent protease
MILLTLPIFLISVVIHEYAHGWVAYKLGDPTAKHAGRLTLNPLVHIDPMGTVFLPLMLVAMRSPIVFGWAKPVPINFSLLRNPKQDMLWVSIAGIMANILLAFIFSLLLRTGVFPINSYGWVLLNLGILVNLVLAVFNAIPIPPLDGSRVLMSILPRELAYSYMQIERFGFLILIGLLWLGLLNRVIWPVVAILARFLGVSIL